MNDSRCDSSNIGVASTPSAPNRCRVVFGLEEKENIPEGSYRMGRVQVHDGEHRREGAAVDQTFSTFMSSQFAEINERLAALGNTNALQNQRIAAQDETIAAQNETITALVNTNALQNQRIAAQDETIAVHGATIVNLTDRRNEYAGLLDDAARLHNNLEDTITQIRQHNADLTIDWGEIERLMRAHDFAMCPLCRERY
jgi:chromosome segregation ATPase